MVRLAIGPERYQTLFGQNLFAGHVWLYFEVSLNLFSCLTIGEQMHFAMTSMVFYVDAGELQLELGRRALETEQSPLSDWDVPTPPVAVSPMQIH